MAWNRIYWDMLDKLFWSPQYMGLNSIPKDACIWSEGSVTVPMAYVNPNGPLYRRTRTARDLWDHLHGQEEILNQVFDLTFAIAPDTLIHQALVAPLGLPKGGPYASIGREAKERYGWTENVTQHDGLFVNDRVAVAVELKLGSKSWDRQVLKYAALLTCEEMYSGEKQALGLLFIIPEQALSRHWNNCGLTGPAIDAGFLDRATQKHLPKTILNLIAHHPDRIRSTLGRMKLHAISWRAFQADLMAAQSVLDVSQSGDQTIFRLLAGLLAQLGAHKGTGLV